MQIQFTQFVFAWTTFSFLLLFFLAVNAAITLLLIEYIKTRFCYMILVANVESNDCKLSNT